jgi:hypothetical protein
MIDVLAAALIAMSPAQAPVFEDDPSWSCVDDGNHVYGRNNSEGKAAGLYDEGGVLIDVWPLG